MCNFLRIRDDASACYNTVCFQVTILCTCTFMLFYQLEARYQSIVIHGSRYLSRSINTQYAKDTDTRITLLSRTHVSQTLAVFVCLKYSQRSLRKTGRTS